MIAKSKARMFAALLILFAVTPPATAFWRIWKEQAPPERPATLSVPLSAVRNSGCGRPDAVRVFGESAFMRREADRNLLPDAARRAIAAAYMAETADVANAILSPYVNAPDPFVRDAARISDSFIALRKRSDGARIHVPQIEEYLRTPMTQTLEADRHYLLAVLALASGNWSDVAKASKTAIELSPKYYNAHVVYSLSQLERIQADELSTTRCEATLQLIEKMLLPLLELGACPMHVAHLDLAAERYLPNSGGVTADKLRIIRRTYLAYVSKNDNVGKLLLADYRQKFNFDGCISRLNSLDFKSPGGNR